MSTNNLPPPTTNAGRESGAGVAFQAAIGWGRAGLALMQNPDDVDAMQEFVGFRRAMSQIQDAFARAQASATVQRQPMTEPQTGISPEAPALPQRGPGNFRPS